MHDPLFSPYFADGDFELGSYRLQMLAQQTRAAFARNAVFPYLTHVTALADAMQNLLVQLSLQHAACSDAYGPGFAPDAYEEMTPEAAEAESFARWAYQLLAPLVYEGETILEFVQEHVHLEPVGALPVSAQEGFLLVRQGSAWRAYRFAAYLLCSSQESALQAEAVAGVEADSPAALRAALVASFPDLPRPATFRLQSDLSFPAEETLLPAAGRKLPTLLWEAAARA